jgi:putative transposase
VARPLRICIPGAVYHVIARGNAREPIFLDDYDRLAFLEILARVIARFGWLCHAYCLMGNHYHLVIETPKGDLPAGMRQLNGLYAQYFNRRQGRCGHVFEARYRSILVEKESYLLEVCRYVVLNPVRAGLCSHPEQWRWSSYCATAGTAAAEPFLCTDWLLSHFGMTREQAQAGYREFVEEGIGGALEDRVRGERLGTDHFLQETFGHDPPLAEIPREHVLPLPPPLDEILAAGDPTPVAIAYRRYGYNLRQIAEQLGCSYSTVSRRLRREEATPSTALAPAIAASTAAPANSQSTVE